MQTCINEWDLINKKIDESKIKRYPYKKYIKESLTNYCFRHFRDGFNHTQVLAKIIKEEGILLLIKDNLSEKEKIEENIHIGVSARYTEFKRRLT